MKYTNEYFYNYKGEEIPFNYVKKPTLTQQMKIVGDIVNGVINDVNGYCPILFNYFFAVSVIDELTDIKLPESFVLSSELITDSNIVGVLKANIFCADSIINAAIQEIEFVKQRTVNKSSIDGLLDALTLIVNKYGDMFEGLDVNAVAENIGKIAEMASMPKNEVISNILEFEKKKSDIESK